MTNRTHSESITVAVPPAELYDLVADVTRMGEWSPVCTRCHWEDGGSAAVGAWFVGHNEMEGRSWDTRCEVVIADPGREFAFVVNGNVTRWGYTFAAVEGGTELTESWEFLPSGAEIYERIFQDRAEDELATRRATALEGITATLAAIKRTAEGG